MRCLRIYAAPDGESYFGEIDIPTTKRSIFPDAAARTVLWITLPNGLG